MSNLVQSIEDAQQIIVNLLFADVDLALTFLKTAEVTSISETRQRNLANAIKAHRAIADKAAATPLNSFTRQQLETKLAELAQKLAVLSESASTNTPK